MTAEHWQRIKHLFEGALSLEPQERDAFLQRECPDAPAVQSEVRRLLMNESRGSDLLELGRRSATSESFAPGDIAAGRFRIVRLLGWGGMGEVYEAEDTLLGERLALKIIRSEIASDQASLTRFRQEIQLARRITHPNVCRIFDLEMHAGDTGRSAAFFTMELLAGETLASRLQRTGPLTPVEALNLALQMSAGLEAAHRCGIIHRDFKSSNVMLVPGPDGSCRAVITDFGLARGAKAESGLNKLTASGNILGTLDYMAPEQLERGESSFRSDIYSLGLVLFEMVTGELPFPEKTPIGSALRRIREAPPSPRKLRPELSRAWEIAIEGCLQCDPAKRIGSAAEVMRVLESERLPDLWWRRHAVWAASAAFLSLLIGASLLLLFLRTANQPAPVGLKPVLLTSYPGMEFHPALSPDGEFVAFSWDGENKDTVGIYTKQIASGVLTRLTNDAAVDSSPAWSPDGRLVAFRRLVPGASQIVVKSYMGGPERKLAEWPYQVAGHLRALGLTRDLCFSPDGKWLVTSGGSAPTDPTGLVAISVETGELSKLTSPIGKNVMDTGPALSPDGRTLAFTRVSSASASEIYILPISGNTPGPLRQITFENKLATNPAWTADGNWIIFSSNREENETTRHLWKLRVSGGWGVPKRPEPELLAGLGENANEPAISGNGRRLAYTQEAHDLNIWELHLPDQAGKPASSERLISSTRDDLFPDFSPDGTKIAFGSDRSGHHEIWVCERDGSYPRKLTSFAGPLTTDPHWSPDGKKVVFSSRAEKNRAEIYLINAQGGPPRRLTHSPADCIAPNWSRDGEWIYFSSSPNGIQQIWKIPAIGGDPVQITKRGGVFAMESPDRKYIYYSTGRDYASSVWKVPVAGGAEVLVLPEVSYRNFAMTDRGIYFIQGTSRSRSALMPMGRNRNNAVVQFYSFETGTVQTIFTTTKPVYRGLVISPNGQSLLYAQFDRQESDLWLVDNFH
jgi:Tol biopolymer transport system component/tRNA A-37 threonylcarbamoyl transferase component Bud32